MPQMAPLSWLTLFIYFTMIIFILNSFNFFFYFQYPKKISFFKNLKKINWKW